MRHSLPGVRALDASTLAEILDRCAAAARSVGLSLPTRWGRSLVRSLLGDTFTVEVDGLRLFGSLEHRHYLWALRDGRQEPYTTELFKAAVKSGMTVCDIGAFIGYYALVAAQRVGSAGRVYAFDPDPISAAFLARNIAHNGMTEIVRAVAAAISSTSGDATFYTHGGDRSRNSLFPDHAAEAASAPVRAYSLDEFLGEDRRVDVIKMDIEGGEVHALDGMERTLRSSRDIVMFVECSPRALRAAGADAETLVARLRALGFEVMVIDEGRRELAPVAALTDAIKYVNLRCHRKVSAARDH